MDDKEGQVSEFKLVWNDNAYKTACAFANTDGGRLYIGYDDNGTLIGLKRVREDIENLPNSIRSKLGLLVSIYAGNKDGKDYLEVSVPAMDQPVFYEGKIYFRVGSTNQLLEGSDLVSFILRKSTNSWDGIIEPNVSIDELEEESFRMLIEDGIRNKRLTEYDRSLTRRELLEKMALMKNGKLTRAAILLFHPHPEYFFGGAHIKLGYFNEKNELRYQDELYGSLLSLAKKVEEILVLKYFYATIDYDGLVRVETLPYPREAVREGILNALMHNNYLSDQPIAIRVSPYDMWISNKCIFPSGWTEETLFSVHESRQLNPNIAVGFFIAGLVERFGSGVQKIVEKCEENGNPRPEYVLYPDMITLKITSRTENTEAALEYKQKENVGVNVENVGINTENVGVNGKNVGVNAGNFEMEFESKSHKLKVRRSSMIKAMEEDPSITANKLSLIFSVSERTVERDIAWMIDNKFITRSGTDKKGTWIVLKELKEDE